MRGDARQKSDDGRVQLRNERPTAVKVLIFSRAQTTKGMRNDPRKAKAVRVRMHVRKTS